MFVLLFCFSCPRPSCFFCFFFFFNDTATTEIYTLSLHDALPIFDETGWRAAFGPPWHPRVELVEDRKSTRLNSSHPSISYAVFCLKKKNTHNSALRTPHTKIYSTPAPNNASYQ